VFLFALCTLCLWNNEDQGDLLTIIMHVLLPLTFFKSQTFIFHRLSMVMIHYMLFHHFTILLLHHFVILSFLCFVVSLLHHSYHALLLHHFVIVLMLCCFIILSLFSCSITNCFSYNIVSLLFAPYLVNYYFITQARKKHIFKKQLLLCSHNGTTIFKL
jgi:hypothetical protein